MRWNRWSTGVTRALTGLGLLLGGCAGDEGDAEPVSASAAQASEVRTPVTLRFKAKVGDDDFACGRAYAGQGATDATITPQDFRFFVQSVRLLAEDGTEVPVQLDVRGSYQTADVALLDFATTAGQCARGDEDTNLTITGSVPAGRYRGVAFVNGVPDSLNHIDPALAPAPLKAPGMSWGWLLGYKFVLASVLEQRAPSAEPAPATADEAEAPRPGVALTQVGSSACSVGPMGFTCRKANRNEVRLTGFDPAVNTIVADFGALFRKSDLKSRVECHSDGADCAPMFDALGIDLATGKPLTTQSVFRVE